MGRIINWLTNDASSSYSGAEDRSPAFNPAGNGLLFISNRADGVFQLWTSDLRGATVTRLGDPGLEIQSFAFRPDRCCCRNRGDFQLGNHRDGA